MSLGVSMTAIMEGGHSQDLLWQSLGASSASLMTTQAILL